MTYSRSITPRFTAGNQNLDLNTDTERGSYSWGVNAFRAATSSGGADQQQPHHVLPASEAAAIAAQTAYGVALTKQNLSLSKRNPPTTDVAVRNKAAGVPSHSAASAHLKATSKPTASVAAPMVKAPKHSEPVFSGNAV